MSRYNALPPIESGRIFGRLTVIERSVSSKYRHVKYACICECGKKTVVPASRLISGGSKSCGCLTIDTLVTHGLSYTPEYRIWAVMIQRCTNPKMEEFHNYGARGISVCTRWRNSFADFYSDMGKRPTLKHEIERMDNEGNYEPSNCRWATRKEQVLNTRHNRVLTLGGISMPMKLWSDKLGIKPTTLSARVNMLGWSDEKALTSPVTQYSKRKVRAGKDANA